LIKSVAVVRLHGDVEAGGDRDPEADLDVAGTSIDVDVPNVGCDHDPADAGGVDGRLLGAINGRVDTDVAAGAGRPSC